MEPEKKKRMQAMWKAAVFMSSPRKQQRTKKEIFCVWCSWLKFGFVTFVVVLCLGLSCIIVGGVYTKIDVLILGGVFIIGSFVLLLVVCAPRGKCNCFGRSNRVSNGAVQNLAEKGEEEDAEKTEEATGQKPILRTKRLSFIRNVMTASLTDSKTRLSSSHVPKFDKSWVKTVENQMRQNQTRSTIEEETNTASVSAVNKDCERKTLEETGFVQEKLNHTSKGEYKYAVETVNPDAHIYKYGYKQPDVRSNIISSSVTVEPHRHVQGDTADWQPDASFEALHRQDLNNSIDNTGQEIHNSQLSADDESRKKRKKRKKRRKKREEETERINEGSTDNGIHDDSEANSRDTLKRLDTDLL